MRLGDLQEHFYDPPQVDLSNTFDVVERVNGNGTVDLAYNLNVSCGIVDLDDIPPNMKSTYTVRIGDHLKIISHRLYGTIDFWWLVAKVNQIDDVLAPLEPGTVLTVFDEGTMGAIYSEVLKLSKRTDDGDAERR